MTKKSTTKPANENKFAGLTNKEIVLVYYRLKQYFDMVDSNLEKGYSTKTINSSIGVTTSLKPVSKESIDKFKQSLYYVTLQETLIKLENVTKLIEECDDEVMSIIQQLK